MAPPTDADGVNAGDRDDDHIVDGRRLGQLKVGECVDEEVFVMWRHLAAFHQRFQHDILNDGFVCDVAE